MRIVRLFVGTFAAMWHVVPAYADFCGSMAQDNRPNRCEVRKGDTWVTQSSKCEKIAADRFLYTHCDGTTQELSVKDGCCLVSRTCSGARYVGVCVGR